MTTVWVAAQTDKPDGVWEVLGIFSSEDLADQVCEHPGDCYWPVTIDTHLGRETSVADAVYPRRQA